MDEQRQDDQLELIYNSCVPIQDVAFWERWTIETDGERRSGKTNIFYLNSTQAHNQNINQISFHFSFFKHYYYFHISCHLSSHHSLKLPPLSFHHTHQFHQHLSYGHIRHYRHHTNYTTEPPTVSTIFPTLSHYDHPQVLPVNVSNIFCIVNNYKHYFFPTLLHYEHPPVLLETIKIIIVTFIIIAKVTQNLTSLLPAHKYYIT